MPANANADDTRTNAPTNTPGVSSFVKTDGFDLGGIEGEMARRIGDFDWSQTSMGPMARWPDALRTALLICLTSRFPILIWWGPDLRVLYNDAYIPFLGKSKHPHALGQPGEECWAEIWPTIGPMLASVMATAKATWSEDSQYFFNRHLSQEEVYVTFTYGPILSSDGREVAGVFCPCTETTGKIVAARRLFTLSRLGERLSRLDRIGDVYTQAAATLGENPLDIAFAAVYEIDADSGAAAPMSSTGLAPSLAARLDRLEQSFAPWPMAQTPQPGTSQVIDLSTCAVQFPGGAWSEPATCAVAITVATPSRLASRTLIVLGVSPRRVLDDEYRTFLELAAGQVGTALANAAAFEAERERAQALARVDRAKTAFFSNVSHEFRTPLTLMLGPLEEAAARGGLPPDLKQQIALAHGNALRLLKLVNSLLEFARSEAGRAQAQFEPTDLAKLTAEIASMFRATVEGAGLRFQVVCEPLPEPVFVDTRMWEIVVLNLLSNAFKFTFAGHIGVHLALHDGQVTLDVSDTGGGIPASEMPRLFERFHQVQGATGRTQEGSGIGLALVRDLVQLHGGTIDAHSTPDQGSRFRVTLPLGQAHLPSEHVHGESRPAALGHSQNAQAFVQEARRWLPAHPPAPGQAPHPAPFATALPQESTSTSTSTSQVDRRFASTLGRRVLVADDNADMRDYLAALLSPLYEVELVGDGREALDAVQRRRPDLLITDSMMPRLDGVGLVRALHEDPRLARLPVMMLTARAGEDARIEAFDAGVDDYMEKPFSAREFKARVGAILERAHHSEQLRQADEILQRRAQQFVTLLDHAPLGVFLVDKDLGIREANPTAEAAFGGEAGLRGQDLARVLHRLWPQPRAQQALARFREALEANTSHVEPEMVAQRLDTGTVECLEWQVHRILLPDGQHGAVCYVRDISAHVRARRKLEIADRQKNEFLATLSHELRNPLAAISNALQVMRLRERKALEAPGGAAGAPAAATSAAAAAEGTRATREVLDRQLRVLVRLVDDLLEVSRITSGSLQLKSERLTLSQVVNAALETSAPHIQANGHRLSVALAPEPLWLEGDAVRLAQVVSNLLDNAAKYTPAGGAIALDGASEGAWAVLRVRDDGVGISDVALAHVFEMFHREDRQDVRARNGMGVGLALARSLVELHGGTIAAHSDGVGRGAEFTVRLPLTAPPEASVPQLQAAQAASGVCVMVVDDNEDSGDSLSMLLETLGVKVALARSGKAALELFTQVRPHAIFMDIGMPDMDGYETARALRALPGGDLPLVTALSGFGSEADRLRSKEARMDGHLVKPVDLESLERLLAELSARQALQAAQDVQAMAAPMARRADS